MKSCAKVYNPVTMSGGGSVSITESPLTVAGGVVTLPAYSAVIGLFYNGQRLTPAVGYNLSGNTATLTGTPPIDDGETIQSLTLN